MWEKPPAGKTLAAVSAAPLQLMGNLNSEAGAESARGLRRGVRASRALSAVKRRERRAPLKSTGCFGSTSQPVGFAGLPKSDSQTILCA